MPDLSTNTTGTALAGELAHATRSELRLGEALRAAADGASQFRVKRALQTLAERLDRGEPLDRILAEKNSPLPAHLSGLMRAALATGHPGQAMAEWLMIREQVQTHWRNVLGAITYPLLTLLGAYGLFVAFSLWLAPELQETLDILQVQIPEQVRAVYWLTSQGAFISSVLFGLLAAMLIAVRVVGGRRGWSLFMSTVPLFGSLWHWSGSCEMYRVLALMLDQRLPLPDALRLTGQGISDAALAKHCEVLAQRFERGEDFERALQRAPELPPSTFPLLRTAQRFGALPAGLRAAAEMLESRLQSQASMLLYLAPTVIFLAVLGLALMMVVGFLIPLVSLIRNLT